MKRQALVKSTTMQCNTDPANGEKKVLWIGSGTQVLTEID
jgi:hypothetical protein